MKKLFLSLLAVMMAVLCALAQNRTISGTVYSASDDEPLMGAAVHALGTNVGVNTGIDGKFTMSVPANATKLRITYVGFEGQEVAITSGDIVVKLKETTVLDEVMVVAYGRAKKSEYTGSASVVKADQLEDALVSDATQALTGKVSGVQTMSSNGQPGTSPTIRIRGVGSINGVSAPLYVVDGMPFNGEVSQINPQDIESMTVLKDAASTALYGARGANGVILITTKKGKAGEAKVTLNARWGVNTRGLQSYDLVTDEKQYLELQYRALKNSAIVYGKKSAAYAHQYANANLWNSLGYQTWTVPEGQLPVGDNGKFNPYATRGYSDGRNYYVADDWVEETLIDGLRQEYSVDIVGGTDRIQYFLSAGYLGDEGIIYGSHFNRFSSRATVDYKAKSWLKVGTNIAYVYTNSAYPDEQTRDNYNSSGNAFAIAYNMAPVYPMYIRDAEGNIQRDARTGLPIYDYGDGQYCSSVRA
ncbi:MAG: SusC/RagA family TonB-linked outer membrane protein, partial [Muribaculaceae bacterium]